MESRSSRYVYRENSLDKLDYGKREYPLVEGRGDKEILREVFIQIKELTQSFPSMKEKFDFKCPLECMFVYLGTRGRKNSKNRPNNEGMVVG